MTTHYRKDNPNGITAPNPDGNRDIVGHITKYRGIKTPYIGLLAGLCEFEFQTVA